MARSRPRMRMVLQFGLDAVVEENAERRSLEPGRKGFNSASTLSSRRTPVLLVVLLVVVVRLQFVLDAVVEENSVRGTMSMGATQQLQFGLDAVVEENGSAAGVRAGRSAGFNSASTLSSRRTTERQANKAAAAALQFGLDAVVEENPSPWAKLNRP